MSRNKNRNRRRPHRASSPFSHSSTTSSQYITNHSSSSPSSAIPNPDPLTKPLLHAPPTALPFLRSPYFHYTLLPTAVSLPIPPATAIEEFRRFLAIKVFLDDRDAVKVSPTGVMDELWHAAILDTRFYEALEGALGRRLHHRPEGAGEWEREEREERRRVLGVMYGYYFGGKPVVAYEEDKIDIVTIGKPKPHPPMDPAAFQIFIKAFDGVTKTADVHPDQTVAELHTQLEKKIGAPADHLRVVFAGAQLVKERTLAECGLRKESTVHLTMRLRGC